MGEQVRRLPWSRELFCLFSLHGFHLVVWKSSYFKASGFISTLWFVLGSINLIAYAIYQRVTSEGAEALLPERFSGSPITSDLNVFTSASSSTKVCLNAMSILIIAMKREQIAEVLNQLNYLWNCLDCPRQKWLPIAFLSCSSGLLVLILELREYILDAPDNPSIMNCLMRAVLCLADFTDMFSPMIIFIIMIFVYGSLISLLERLNSQIASRDDFTSSSNVRESVRSICSLLSTFSKVVSPLAAVSLSSIVLVITYVMFHLVLPPTTPDSPLFDFSAILIYCSVVAVSMSLSNHVCDQLTRLRCQMNSGSIHETTEGSFRALDFQLMTVPHPPKAMGLFTLDLSIIVTLAAFVLTYYMVFVQLKAIVVGSCLGPPSNAAAVK